MKKTLLTCLALTALVLVLFVSCNAEASTPVDTDGLAYVTFGDNLRSFSATYEIEKYEELYWFYTAEKTDGHGTTGATETWKPVTTTNDGVTADKGLSGTIGPFSSGDWSFDLKAYSKAETTVTKDGADNTKITGVTYTLADEDVVYVKDGDITATLYNGQTKAIAAKVKPNDDATGSIKFSNAYFEWADTQVATKADPTAPCFMIKAVGIGSSVATHKTYVFTNDEQYSAAEGEEKITIILGEYDSDKKGYPIAYTMAVTGNPETVTYGDTQEKIVADYYSCTVSSYTYSTDTTTKVTDKIPQANDYTFAFRVYGSATTVISGDITEDPQSEATFKVAEQQILQFVKDSSGTDGKTTISSANGGTITFSNKILKDDAYYVVDRNDLDAAAASNSFVVMAKNSEGNEGTAAVFGSTSLVMNKIEGTQSERIREFAEEVSATIPVPTNLNGDDIAVYYVDDDGNIDYTKDYMDRSSYNKESGLVPFKSNHWSTFVVASKTAASIYNVTQKRYYSTLQDAVANLEGTSELKLNTDCTVTTDFIELNTKLTLDLNGKTITANTVTEDLSGKAFGLFILKSNSNLTVKNGNITTERKTKADYNFQTLKIDQNSDNVSLTVENVKITAPNGVIISAGVSNIDVTVRDSQIYYSTWGYGIGTNAEEPSEKGNVNIEIENTFIGPREGITETGGNDYTGLLLNVPTTVTITSSEIHGGRQAAIFRGGDYTVSGSTFGYTTDNSANKAYEDKVWSGGNNVPNAAIVIGNRSDSYAYPTSVTFIGENALTVPAEGSNHLYIWQNSEEYPVTVAGEISTAESGYALSFNDNFNGAAVKLTNENTLYVASVKCFEDAVESAKEGDTIKLLSDLDFTSLYAKNVFHEFEFKFNTTIDLNGHTVKSNNGGVCYEGPITIKNGTFDANGGSYALFIGNGHIDESEGDLWTATVENISCAGGINVFCHKLIVEDCRNTGETIVSGTSYYALWSDEGGQITVNSGTFTSDATESGIVLNTPVLKEGPDDNKTPVLRDDGNQQFRADAFIKINGGTFTAKEGNKLFNGNILINGGSFSQDPTGVTVYVEGKEQAVNILATGKKATLVDGMYSVD